MQPGYQGPKVLTEDELIGCRLRANHQISYQGPQNSFPWCPRNFSPTLTITICTAVSRSDPVMSGYSMCVYCWSRNTDEVVGEEQTYGT